jgi:hypothetical protein
MEGPRNYGGPVTSNILLLLFRVVADVCALVGNPLRPSLVDLVQHSLHDHSVPL